MLKRLKVWTYLAVATGASLLQFGCGWLGNDTARIIYSILREDIFG